MYYITNGKELMLLNCGVLEKTFESPLDCKEIKPDNPKGNQPWIFLEGLMLKLKLQLLWPPDVNSQLFGKDPDTWKDWRQEKETTADKMVGWHHWLNGVSFRRWWRTGKPGMLQSTGLQRVGHNWVTEQQQKHLFALYYIINVLNFKNKFKNQLHGNLMYFRLCSPLISRSIYGG